RLDRRWGPHQIDLFATRQNAKTPQFVTWRWDPTALATDAMALDCSLQTSTGAGQCDTDHTVVADSNLVPDPQASNTTTSLAHTCEAVLLAPGQEASGAIQEPPLVSHSLANKMRRLEEAGATEAVGAVILHSDHHHASQQYQYIQQHFLSWCQSRRLEALELTGKHLVNFLGYSKDKLHWSINMIKVYRSALLDLFDDRDKILSLWLYTSFMKALDGTTLRRVPPANLDITPVLHHFRHLGPNVHLSPAQLTAKNCWLLAICGFMHPSDIERTDLDRCLIDEASGKLTLTIVCPKERRQGQRITKTISIDSHEEPLFCPVTAFAVYKTRFASQSCHAPHPVLSEHNITSLFVICTILLNTSVHNELASTSISLWLLSQSPPGGRRIRARALGSTRAAWAGAVVDDIVAHGSWSSRQMFDLFYRISRETRSNLSSL
ncbi:hypothetical protein BDB00DRAFT_751203, partial [Zychaea mexicana]|uniref:uncharacterized protein n=1 Tax=Zychaea mexicana TaxID=64656 RepID=UPI0022FF297C